MQDEYEFYEDKFNGIKLYSDSDFITYKTIIEELMKGYMYKDKVLKYSKVIVCKK